MVAHFAALQVPILPRFGILIVNVAALHRAAFCLSIHENPFPAKP
jgi:hypothetical protein